MIPRVKLESCSARKKVGSANFSLNSSFFTLGHMAVARITDCVCVDEVHGIDNPLCLASKHWSRHVTEQGIDRP
jgi:hypothetical protein